MQTTLSVDGMDVDVTYKRIKNMYLRVQPPDGRVCVSAPNRMGEKQIVQFVRERRAWIDRRRAACTVPERRLENGECVVLWGELAPLVLRAGRGSVIRTQNGVEMHAPAGADMENRKQLLDGFYREELRAAIARMVPVCEKAVGAHADEWRIRDMKTRWGSCNVIDKRIWLNLRLAEKPPECLRYVMCHELCHLFEHGHGKAFWARMDGCCPDWKVLRKRLNGKDATCT